MKNIKAISYSTAIIVVAIVALIITQQCTKTVSEPSNSVWKWRFATITRTDTIYDTTRIVSEIYIPVQGETVYVEIPSDYDCDELAKDYYAERHYNDTLKNDTSAFISVQDIVYQNRIVSRQWEFENKRPTVINTTTTTVTPPSDCPPHNSFNLGFGGFVAMKPTIYSPTDTVQGYIGAGPSIMLTTNKKASYGVSYDLINKVAQLTILWNIK